MRTHPIIDIAKIAKEAQIKHPDPIHQFALQQNRVTGQQTVFHKTTAGRIENTAREFVHVAKVLRPILRLDAMFRMAVHVI